MDSPLYMYIRIQISKLVKSYNDFAIYTINGYEH